MVPAIRGFSLAELPDRGDHCVLDLGALDGGPGAQRNLVPMAPARVDVYCPHCRTWSAVPPRARWWECNCGSRLNAVRCPSCDLTDLAVGEDPDTLECGSCGRSSTNYPDEFKSTAGAFGKTLKWRGAQPGDQGQQIVYGNRIMSVHGVDVPVGATASLCVSADRLTLAGVDSAGSRFSAHLLRNELVDLRIELHAADITDNGTALTRFTILGAPVGKAVNSLVNSVLGHEDVEHTVFTLATESAVVTMKTTSITPEDADAMLVPVEVDISANRKRIIDEYSVEPEADLEADEVELLGELAELHGAGVLTDEEFSDKKAEILSRL